MKSIRSRMLTLFGLSILIGYLLVLICGVSLLLSMSERWANLHLTNQVQTAAWAWEAIGGCANEIPAIDYDKLDPTVYSKSRLGLIAYCDGEIVTQTREAFAPPELTADPQYSYNEDGSETWFLGYPVENGWIFATVSDAFLAETEDNFLIWMIVLTLIFLSFALISVYFGITRFLRPISRLNEALDAVADNQLNKISLQDYPSEMRPLVSGFNTLLERIDTNTVSFEDRLMSERRFTANAAHELLTPMAAIKTEVQLQRRLASSQELQRVFQEIDARVDRASHTIDQLMTLARLDPEAAFSSPSNFDLAAKAHRALSNNAAIIEKRGLSVAFDCPDILEMSGVEHSMDVMVDNLVANACKYALENSKVSLSLRHEAAGIEIATENQCHRLPTYLLEHITDRFVRGANEREQGTGLGMSIIKRSVELNRGHLEIQPSDDGRQLRVAAWIPIAQERIV